MMLKKIVVVVVAISLCSLAWAQTGTIKGVVTNEKTNEPIPGANVVIKGTSLGAASNNDGAFTIENVPTGKHKIQASVIGFEKSVKQVTVSQNQTSEVNFALRSSSLNMEELEVVANYADVETPVTYSDINQQELEQTIGTRDLPLALNTTPNVYATAQGGGSGDARINIRGFSQDNIAVMINGVPVNDMESGWVYWSNWAGLSEIASKVQVQRGIGSSSLAVSSVGGTMNMITQPADMSEGGSFQQSFGSGNLKKTSFSYNTGLINDKFAASFAFSRKTRDGIADMTWTDAWSYYGAMSYNFTEDNRLSLFVVGAPQKHGERDYAQNIGTFDASYASDLSTYDKNAPKEDYGITYNPNWGNFGKNLSNYYALWTRKGEKHSKSSGRSNRLSTAANYYHKPQANLNWYYDLNEKLSIKNVAYYSQGIGGGVGSSGISFSDIEESYSPYNFSEFDKQGQRPIQKVYEYNTSNATIDSSIDENKHNSKTVLSNAVNQHIWYGDIFSVEYDLNKHFDLNGGIDVRHYKGEHWTEVRNLLGGDYFQRYKISDNSDTTKSQQMYHEGDKIEYHNDGLVNWYGGFGKIKSKFGSINSFLSGAYAVKSYKREDYFLAKEGVASTGWNRFNEWNVKTGVTYEFTNNFDVYGNFGYISKAPKFDDVYDYYNNVADDIFNEKVTTVEGGLNYRSDVFVSKLAMYSTLWRDRSIQMTTEFETDRGEEDVEWLIKGLDELHQGIEFEGTYRPMELLNFKFAFTYSKNEYKNDVRATYVPSDAVGEQERDTAKVYLKGLNRGDAPQKSIALTSILRPTEGASMRLVYKHYWDYTSAFDPSTRVYIPKTEDYSYEEVKNHPAGWQVPAYGLLDAHASFKLPIELPSSSLKFNVHVFNVMNARYITDATDNSSYQGYDYDHDADDAGVFFGLPRRVTAGIELNF